jgi:hypothetical protein
MIKGKGFGTGMLVLAMLLVSVVSVSAASAAADKASAKNPSDSKVETYGIKGLTPEKVKEIEAETSSFNKMPDTVKNCPYAGLLVANDEQKKIFLGYFDKMSVSDSEKKEMKNALQDMWKRVPNKITEKDYPKMEKIGKAVTSYVENTYWKGRQSVQWMSKAHTNLISAGVNLVYANPTYASKASSYAMYPDTTIDAGSIDIPVPLPGGLWVTLSLPKSCYYHYYNPSVGFGGAPGKCSSYASSARSFYQKKDYNNAFINLGIASHYISDVTQPMHSGSELNSLKNYLLNWGSDPYHMRYEQYVDDNWGTTGHNFGKWVTQNTEVKSITDPAAAVKSAATTSHVYSDKLFAEIYAHPNFDKKVTPNPDDTTYIQYVTIIMNQEAAKYNAGLAKYIKS